MSHARRAALASRFPVHVTLKLRRGLPSLRRAATYRAAKGALVAGAQRFGFRLVHYSVQSNHLHLIAEAQDRRALSRGLRGLLVRLARALNRAWARAGSVFADRYHDHVLRTPREVRNALAYVLGNARKHGIAAPGLDPFSSSAWFDGWRGVEAGPSLIARARTWLLAVGWRKRGCLDPSGARVG